VSRPRLLLLARGARERLRLVDALAATYEIEALGPDEEAWRALRRSRPALVLIALAEGGAADALFTLRAIRTEAGQPPPVALFDPHGALGAPDHPLPDGIFTGEATPEALLAFLSALRAGARPRVEGPRRKPSLLRRLLGR
jgi:hypothetical protein